MKERSREDVAMEFIALIRAYIRANGDQPITERSHLIADLNVNSARLVDIILETEDHFGIRIDDAAADRLHRVGDSVDVIIEKMAAGF
jgi:acyl carrier protein